MEQNLLSLTLTAETTKSLGDVITILSKFSKEFSSFYFLILAPRDAAYTLFHIFTSNGDNTGVSFVMDNPTMEVDRLDDSLQDSILLELSTEHCRRFVTILQQEQNYPLKLIIQRKQNVCYIVFKRFMTLRTSSKNIESNRQFQYCHLSVLYPTISLIIQPTVAQYIKQLINLLPPTHLYLDEQKREQSQQILLLVDIVKYYIDLQNGASIFTFNYSQSNSLQFLINNFVQFQICSKKFSASDYQQIKQIIHSKLTASQLQNQTLISDKPLQAPQSRVYVESPETGEFYLESVKSLLFTNKVIQQQIDVKLSSELKKYQQLLELLQQMRFSQLSIDMQHCEDLLKNFFLQTANVDMFQTTLLLTNQHVAQLLNSFREQQINSCQINNSVFGIQRKIGGRCYAQLRIGPLNNYLIFEAVAEELQRAMQQFAHNVDLQQSSLRMPSPQSAYQQPTKQQHQPKHELSRQQNNVDEIEMQQFDIQNEPNTLFTDNTYNIENFSPIPQNLKRMFQFDKNNDTRSPHTQKNFQMDFLKKVDLKMSDQLIQSDPQSLQKSALHLDDLNLISSGQIAGNVEEAKYSARLQENSFNNSSIQVVSQHEHKFIKAEPPIEKCLDSSEIPDDRDILSILNTSNDDLNVEIPEE